MPVFTPNLTVAIPVMVIISLIIGIDVGWGYIQVYIASYLHSHSPSITTSKVHMLFSVMDLGQIIGAQIFQPVTSKLGYRESLSLALAFTATGAFICSIATTI
jgi:MFS family permease